MKNIFHVSRLLTLAACVTLSMQSCLTENMDDCLPDEPGVRIVVKTIADKTRVTGDTYDIENVTIYIFDQNQRYYGSWVGEEFTYGTDYVAHLDIDPGRYHFVVWTNQGTAYDKTVPTYGPNDPAEALVVGLKTADYSIREDVPDLHHGMIEDAEVIAGTQNEFTVYIQPNTYQLDFTVEGLPENGNEYSFTIRDNNSHYTFDNRIPDTAPQIEYIRTTGFVDGKLCSSMKVLKLSGDRTPDFDFSDVTEGLSLFNDCLIDVIKNAYSNSGQEVDFDRTFRFDIKLKFNADLGVTISVNGWNYSPNNEIIG